MGKVFLIVFMLSSWLLLCKAGTMKNKEQSQSCSAHWKGPVAAQNIPNDLQDHKIQGRRTLAENIRYRLQRIPEKLVKSHFNDLTWGDESGLPKFNINSSEQRIHKDLQVYLLMARDIQNQVGNELAKGPVQRELLSDSYHFERAVLGALCQLQTYMNSMAFYERPPYENLTDNERTQAAQYFLENKQLRVEPLSYQVFRNGIEYLKGLNQNYS